MPLPKDNTYTSEDYWNLPEGERAELINGQFYSMAPPDYVHQSLTVELSATLRNHIKENDGSCKVLVAPFAVNLNANDETWVEPDVMVICDKEKITPRGCNGAPDFIIEIVSPSSRKMDYTTKNALYSNAGVREYWIVDPAKERTTIYRYEEDAAPTIVPFENDITVGIYQSLSINMADLLK